VKSDVGEEIAAEAEVPTEAQLNQEKAIADELRESSVREVAETHREVERGRVAARVSQIVDYVFFLIYSFLGIRLILELLAARESAGFVKMVKAVTGVFYQPFQGIVPSPSVEGGFTLALPIVVAMVAYALLHMAINGFLHILASRKTVV